MNEDISGFSPVNTAGPITASMFTKYAMCPHWLWFDAYGDPSKKAQPSAFGRMLLERGILHEEDVIAHLTYVMPDGETMEERAADTLRLMASGEERIYQGVLMTEGMRGIPDLLEKRTDRPSSFGGWHYVPVDIKSGEKLSDTHRYQLSFYADLLSAVQGIRPKEAHILNKSGDRVGFVVADFEDTYRRAFAEIRRVLGGECPPPQVSSGCKQSPWFTECVALAEAQDDIALLYNMRKTTIDALRDVGIRTVHDVARMDVAAVRRRDRELTEKTLERAQAQAQALIDGKHRVRKAVVLPDTQYEVFFDIEGDPLRGVEYLFGFLVRKNGEEEYVHFLADAPEDEARMWADFVGWTAMLPNDYAVYHFGNYEIAKMGAMQAKYGGSASLDRFRNRMIDLNTVVKDSIVFPLYFYSIKDIGKYIGFERSAAISGGGESVAFYEQWLETKDPKVMGDILRYNEDDVIATRVLKDWLVRQA